MGTVAQRRHHGPQRHGHQAVFGLFDQYVRIERVPSEATVERHEGRPAEQECMLRTHRAGVLQCSCDDEPSQAPTLHTGGDGHPADSHHLCLGITDSDRQSPQAGVSAFVYWGSRTTYGAAADRLSDMPPP
ncbi:hypothetical protein AQJ46_44355 [Streptomyces canus]|uniref:Uncharacterized protein n=1 Tax=Streptomyces canus TaxID=58343 RepID=A0A101RLY5_9ACTN|nr:hypothetical protein AQJ46_44355 [Streptomyces canus]